MTGEPGQPAEIAVVSKLSESKHPFIGCAVMVVQMRKLRHGEVT